MNTLECHLIVIELSLIAIIYLLNKINNIKLMKINKDKSINVKVIK